MHHWLRTFISLTRPALLPTIWSNCLAGWWLGGARNLEQLPFVFAGATLLYLGAAFLNDAFDINFDRQQRPQRPVPARAVRLKSVWRWSLGCLVLGSMLLFWAGTFSGALGLVIVVLSVGFNALHRFLTFAPVLLGVWRLLLYVLGASVALYGVTGWAVWCGLAVAAYAIGQAWFRRWQLLRTPPRAWPVLLFALPVLLALLMNPGRWRERALLLSLAYALWLVRTLRQAFWPAEQSQKSTAGLLLAGMVFADWLACCNGPRELSAVFLGLFLLCAVLQYSPSAS